MTQRKMVQWTSGLVVAILCLFFLISCIAAKSKAEPMAAQPPALTMAEPEAVGLSSDRLARIDAHLLSDIRAQKYDGAVLLIARKGRTAYFKSFGKRDAQKELPMEKDSIFRVHSMTKSVIGIAVAQLMEQGQLILSDPVFKYIPAFRDVKVAQTVTNEAGEEQVVLRKPKTPITILDLLRHTSGMGYWFMAPRAVQMAYLKAGMRNLSGLSSIELAEKIATLPLMCDPGTQYNYGVSFDVLGGIIEVIAGHPLEQYIKESFCDPLGMKDTGFIIPQEDAHRLVALSPRSPYYTNPLDKDKAVIGGGGAMVGTAMDFARFGQMLLNGGELDGLRFLSPATVALATSDHIGPLGQRSDLSYVPGPAHGQGFGFYVRTSVGGGYAPGSIGEYYKQGIGGTVFWVDPQQELVAVFMVTKPAQRETVRYLIKDLIYQAIVE